MRRTTCDGCLTDIEDGDPWIGMDEFPAEDDWLEDEDVDDSDYAFHFHNARCVWAWASERTLEITE